MCWDNVLWQWVVVVIIILVFVLLLLLLLWWWCLREGVIDGWIQANYYIQDIIRWSDFMISYDMEQNRD